jgi:hypothetical protein
VRSLFFGIERLLLLRVYTSSAAPERANAESVIFSDRVWRRAGKTPMVLGHDVAHAASNHGGVQSNRMSILL